MDATSFLERLSRLAHSLWLILLVFACVSSAEASTFDDANRLYDEGKFGEAKQRYEELISRGEWSANLFHNLGNTDFRLGASGRAMLDYERALALEPGHAEAHRNLALLRERTNARVEPRRWYDMLFPAWNGDVFTIICAVAGWVAIFCFASLVAAKSRRSGLVWLGVAFVCVALYAGAGIWRSAHDQSLAIITAKEAVARLAPAEQGAIATTLPAGSRVRVLSERGDWIYCELPGEGLGWLPAGSLERVRIRT
ncbi:hypothetical protein ACXR0O_17180 [Verrucomicrobiota bacterium sgz303538]